MSRYLPVLDWGRHYNRHQFASDLLAALIVTIMLIPQSLAYAMLAGLPAQMGLYASIVPLVLYAVFGTSRTLAVGPVAVISLMTAAAIGNLGLTEPADVAAAALVLALLSGLILTGMGVLRLGFIANFLSHPVIAGFITATGILIATSQVKHILGVTANGHTLVGMVGSLLSELPDVNIWTIMIGMSALLFLFWIRSGLKPLLVGRGIQACRADIVVKAGPIAAVFVSTLLVWVTGADARGVAIVGDVPQGLPLLTLPRLDPSLWTALFMPALLISVIGFVESVSVAQTLAARQRQRITPDQELIGLGTANVGAALTGGYPVTGGFARSVVNFDAGAQTPAAGAFTAFGIALVTVAFTPLLYFLPVAVLAATIIVAVLSLVDLSILPRAWRYSRADFIAVAVTIMLTLTLGVEIGVTSGVIISLILFMWHTAHPHIAELGLVEGTEHFRNIDRHQVQTWPEILMLRVDESLYFANARYLEDYISARLARDPEIKDVILLCSAVNDIDMSALESLEAIDQRLREAGATLHFSEMKGPVTDKLNRTDFFEHLSGRLFLSHFEALRAVLDRAP